MKRAVHKYHVHLNGDGAMLPEGAKIIHCAMQDGSPMVWAVVDPSEYVPTRMDADGKPDVVGLGTGWNVDVEDQNWWEYKHVQTLIDGSFVWHIFAKERFV